MHPLILVLLLIAPQDHAIAEKIGADVSAVLGEHGRVLLGADATAELARQGLKDADLASAPAVGEQLTLKQEDLVLVRLESRKSGGDQVIDSAVWMHGHVERHVSIAGAGHDVVAGASRGVIAVLASIVDQTSDAPGGEDARLAQLAESEDWSSILALVDPFGPPPATQSARALYYAVLANVHLERRGHAREVLARMRTQHPDHVLTAAAGALLPEEPAQP
jgi:hypothetical protein